MCSAAPSCDSTRLHVALQIDWFLILDRCIALQSQRPAELPATKGGKRQIDLLTEKLKG